MRLLTLPALCRRAGLDVVEVSGWQQRGAEMGNVGAVLAHHTATGRNWSDSAVDALLRDGRPGIPGPLSQVGLDRKGRVRIIAAGTANHAGRGSWHGVSGNSRAVGVEAYNDGTGETWPAVQLDAWDALNAVLLDLLDLPVSRLCGHREWAPTRKTDPAGIDLTAMRARAASLLTTPTTEEIDVTPDQDARLSRIEAAVVGLIASGINPEVKNDLKGWIKQLDANLYWTSQGVTASRVEQTALRAELAALRESAGLDPQATADLVRERIDAALADLTLTIGKKET